MRNLLYEVIDYTLCGYVGDLVCCEANCKECDEVDKIINREMYKIKYGDSRKVLQSKKNTRKTRNV